MNVAKTKLSMVRKTVTNANDAIGMYLDGDVCKEWYEDYIEPTGKTIKIKRNEKLCQRGRKIDADLASSLNFYLQSEDITELKVCNQSRPCYKLDSIGLWRVSVFTYSNQIYLLQAPSIETAMKIIDDWMEQQTYSSYVINGAERLYGLHVVMNEDSQSSLCKDDSEDFYVVKIRKYCFERVDGGDLKEKEDLKALVLANTAGAAEEIAMKYFDKSDEVMNDRILYKVHLVSKAVSQLNVTEILPDDFCVQYSSSKENDI